MDRTNWRRKDEIFKSKKHLGSGTFGRVQKVLNKLDGKTYALKLIENVQTLYLESIQSEAEAMMRAKSDYTVELLDHFYDDQSYTYVFVMPYYSKGSLHDYLEKKKTKWDKLDILCFLYQICQAFLSFNQQRACWHLDLKPDNILIKSEGQYLICDFGCAKLVDNINNSRFLEISMNRGGGTTLYAAPEIILKYEGGKYSDVWSLGIMLYKIIYGKHPLDRVIDKLSYSQIIKNFAEGKVKIQYPNILGYEDIIVLCKQILQPEKRMDWDQLKKAIYICIGIPLKAVIVVNIERFISFAQNISKIVMGLVYYLQKNEKHLQRCGLNKDAEKIIISCKTYVSLFYREVENAIEKSGQNKVEGKNNDLEFYIFPQIAKNYTIQQKQRLTHLRAVAQKFCQKEYKQNLNSSFSTVKMNFQCDIQEFLIQLRQKHFDQMQIHQIFQSQKIQRICTFILRRSQQKYPGLQFHDRDVIEKFANQLVNQ